MMKKISILVIFSFAVFFSQSFSADKQELWLKAVSEKDVKVRLQLLEEFAKEYGNDGRYFKNLHINLTKSAFHLRDFDKTIEYGEKVISLEDLEANYKIEMYLYLANSYNVTKKDLDKAYQYADLVVELAKEIKSGFEKEEILRGQINAGYLAPALSIQSIILYTKGISDAEILKNALAKALEAYEFDTSERTEKRIFLFAIALFKRNPDMVDDSIKAVEKIFETSEEPDPRYAYTIGQWYLKKKDRENAIKYLSFSYETNRKSNMATTLGQLLHKSDPEKAIEYFAESFLLDDSDKESNAYKYLRQLWYNNVAKDKTRAEQDEGFNQILKLAKERLDSSISSGEDLEESPEEETGETAS